MPSSSQWIAFLVASVVFVVVPGPSVLFTIGRALTVGRRDALLSAWGNAVGILGQVLLVALGLGALVAASATAYTVIKVAGAAYVIWLGVQAVRHRADARRALLAGEAHAPETARRALGTGTVVGLTNPKSLVFFVAFLPQFTSTSGSAVPQLVVLGLVFATLCALCDSVWALAAGTARQWFAREPARLDRLGVAGGVAMVGLGATMATQK